MRVFTGQFGGLNMTEIRNNIWRTAGVLLLALFSFCPALYAQDSSPVHYVNVSNTAPVAPFVTWAGAATNIQDAIDVAANGDTVLVTDGTYASGGRAVYGTMTNRVAVDRPVVVQSVNGPEVTVIQGHLSADDLGSGAIRCVYLTNGAVLNGFTLANGSARWTVEHYGGGGVFCESPSAVVTNCTLTGNRPWALDGGGAYGGTLNNCTLTGNMTTEMGNGGGAAYSTLNNCTLTGGFAAVSQHFVKTPASASDSRRLSTFAF
jgi:hypothetical protein